MPEIPDLKIYVEHLEKTIKGQTMGQVRLLSIFLLRSVEPPLSSYHGNVVTTVKAKSAQMG